MSEKHKILTLPNCPNIRFFNIASPIQGQSESLSNLTLQQHFFFSEWEYNDLHMKLRCKAGQLTQQVHGGWAESVRESEQIKKKWKATFAHWRSQRYFASALQWLFVNSYRSNI